MTDIPRMHQLLAASASANNKLNQALITAISFEGQGWNERYVSTDELITALGARLFK